MNEDMPQQILSGTERNPMVHSDKNIGWCRTVKRSKAIMNWPTLTIADQQVITAFLVNQSFILKLCL